MKRIYGLVVDDNDLEVLKSFAKQKGFSFVPKTTQAYVSESQAQTVFINPVAVENYEKVEESVMSSDGPKVIRDGVGRTTEEVSEVMEEKSAGPSTQHSEIVSGSEFGGFEEAKDAPATKVWSNAYLTTSDYSGRSTRCLLNESLIRNELYTKNPPSYRLRAPSLNGAMVTVMMGPSSSIRESDDEFFYQTSKSRLAIKNFVKTVKDGDAWYRRVDITKDGDIAKWYCRRYAEVFSAVSYAGKKIEHARVIPSVFDSCKASGVAWNAVFAKALIHETGPIFGPCIIRELNSGANNFYESSDATAQTNLLGVAKVSHRSPGASGFSLQEIAATGSTPKTVGAGVFPIHFQQELFLTQVDAKIDEYVFDVLVRSKASKYVEEMNSLKMKLKNFDPSKLIPEILGENAFKFTEALKGVRMARFRPKSWFLKKDYEKLVANEEKFIDYFKLVDFRLTPLYGAGLMCAVAEGFDSARKSYFKNVPLAKPEGVEKYSFNGAHNKKIWEGGDILPALRATWSINEVKNSRPYGTYADYARSYYGVLQNYKIKSFAELYSLVH